MKAIRSLVLGALMSFASAGALAASPLEAILASGKAVPFYGNDLASDPLQLSTAIKRSQLAERMAAMVNSAFLLRQNLGVGFAACGTQNAFFAPDRNAIFICYEFIELLSRQAKLDPKAMELDRAKFGLLLNGALWSVFLHELGHALVHINQVPITGRGEDVADQFAAWYGLTFMDQERQPTIFPSLWFWTRMASTTDVGSMSIDERRQFMANEHSLDEQRVFNIACLALGSGYVNPNAIIAAAQMPQQRAGRCSSEYSQVDFAMQRSFRKFLKVRPLRGTW